MAKAAHDIEIALDLPALWIERQGHVVEFRSQGVANSNCAARQQTQKRQIEFADSRS